MRQSELANDLTSALWTAHANLYRLAATAATEKDDKKIQAFAKDATTSTDRIADALGALETSHDRSLSAGDFAKLKASVSGYIKQSKTAIEMTDDSGSGLMFIKGAERQFNEAARIADDLIQSSNDSRNLEIARSEMRLDRQQLTMGVVLVVVAIMGILFSFSIGRSISRPVVAMSAAMRRLAVGDFSVQLPGLDRGDEVGQMARAVEEFKIQAVAKAGQELAERDSKARELAQTRRMELHDLAQRSRPPSAILSNMSTRHPAIWKIRRSC